MLNHRQLNIPFNMAPNGSLNSLPVSHPDLSTLDPLRQSEMVSGSELMSRRALIDLLRQLNHRCDGMLRPFINEFNSENEQDQLALKVISRRLAAVIQAAQLRSCWKQPDAFSARLHAHWGQTQTIILAGGLVSPPFGAELATAVENLLPELTVIASPWGGQTALIGMAEALSFDADIAVFDFGSTNVKHGIAHRFGNRIELHPEFKLAPYLQEGHLRVDGLRAILARCRSHYERPLPVAISMAVYLQDGHPFDYITGKYQDLRHDCTHLSEALHRHWLPEAGFGELLMLAHDSTAAALSFKFRQPAMMLTLGTGLGSAPCPLG